MALIPMDKGTELSILQVKYKSASNTNISAGASKAFKISDDTLILDGTYDLTGYTYIGIRTFGCSTSGSAITNASNNQIAVTNVTSSTITVNAGAAYVYLCYAKLT